VFYTKFGKDVTAEDPKIQNSRPKMRLHVHPDI